MSPSEVIEAISKSILKLKITKLDPSQNVDGITLSQALERCNNLLNDHHNNDVIDQKERYKLVGVCRSGDNGLVYDMDLIRDVDNAMMSCANDAIPVDAVRTKQIRYKKCRPELQVLWETEDTRGATKVEYECDSLFRETTTIVPKNSERDPKDIYSKIRKTGAGYSQEASAYLVGRSKSWGLAQDASLRRET